MEFEWDPVKGESNRRKHGVDFDEASTIFGDRWSLTALDPDHSDDEDRFVTLGTSFAGRLLVVVHLDRGDNTRIISAREATRREREAYEDGSFP